MIKGILNSMSIITEAIHILGDSLAAFKHRVVMFKSVIYSMHYEHHKYHNFDYSEAE